MSGPPGFFVHLQFAYIYRVYLIKLRYKISYLPWYRRFTEIHASLHIRPELRTNSMEQYFLSG
jgi:hypothetical protein